MSGAPDFCIAWFPSHALYKAGWSPGRGSPTETFKVVVIDMQRVRLVVRVAYPLTGTLLLISQSSADCISSVRNLLSHPRHLCHWCVWVHLSAISVEAAYLLCKKSEDTETWLFLHERRAKRLPKDVTPNWN